jgi:addiction module HigA family antidote
MATRARRTRRPSLPGEILSELYLAPNEISIARFAEACGVTRKHMSCIVHGHAAITAEMATRIAAVLGTSAQYWLNLQNAVDLFDAEERLTHSGCRPEIMEPFKEAPA